MKTNPATNKKINNLLQKVGGATIGYVGVDVLMEMGPQQLRDNELYVGVAAAGGGGYLAFKADSPLMEGLGIGIAAAGAKRVIKGIAKMSGMNIPGISGLNDASMAGLNDAYMAGYTEALAANREEYPNTDEEAY